MKIRKQSHRGITLIEVTAVMVVIGLLLAILLPAIHSAREPSRRVQCTNNLKQLGLAIVGYTTTYAMMPPGNRDVGFSLHCNLLPYMDQTDLYNSINFSDTSLPVITRSSGSPNGTAATTLVAAFLCPSENSPRPGGIAPTSYAGNKGFGCCLDQSFSKKPLCNSGAITLDHRECFPPSQFTDGLSTTVAMAEWITGRGPIRKDLPKTLTIMIYRSIKSQVDFDESMADCADQSSNPTRFELMNLGATWMNTSASITLYDHAVLLNRPACKNDRDFLFSGFPAGSWHPGGANVVFADGHVVFQKETTALATWHALGTRNGGETIPDDSL